MESRGCGSSLVLTHSLRNTPESILHFWGVLCTWSRDCPLNSLINVVRSPRSPFSSEPPLLSAGLCSTTVFWTGNLRRHHSSLLFGFWPAAPAKLRSKMGISATMYTTAHTHIHTLLAQKNRHHPHSICNLLLHRETLEWLRGSALLLCVCECVCVCFCLRA